MFKRAVHPGVVLREELSELGVTPAVFARQIDVPANRVSQIIAGKRSITGDTALRFGHWFEVEPQFWMNLQTSSTLPTRKTRSGKRFANCQPPPTPSNYSAAAYRAWLYNCCHDRSAAQRPLLQSSPAASDE